MRSDRPNRRRPTRNLAVVVGVVLLIATVMSAASAATTTERWTAKLGSIGQYGSVTLTRTVNNGYSRYDISASVKHFRPKTTYTVTDASGTCSVPGGYITSPLIQNLRTNAAGSASVSYHMSYEKGNVLIEAMNAYLGGDTGTGKAILCDLANATVGFDELAHVLKQPSKSYRAA